MSKASSLRENLDHPVIDADGHWLEYWPVVGEAMKRIGGEAALRATRITGEGVRRSLGMTTEERRRRNLPQEAFWGAPTRNTRDRATAMMPAFLYERLDEFGIDFMMLFPSRALPMTSIPEAELRQLAIRAPNVYHREVYAEFADRMRPVAVVPAHTPEEAIAELEFAASELGAKAVMINGVVQRPLETGGTRLDTLAFDSEHDYEPLWHKLAELRVAPCFHASGQGWGSRRSPSSYVYNHIGHFEASAEALCKSLFLGGVTRRFPELRIALLEGGVGWGCSLYSHLVEHWEKRNLRAIRETLDPALLDVDAFAKLAN